MKPSSYRREQVVDIINSVIGKLKTPNELSHETIVRELAEVKTIIDNLRHELHVAKPAEISNTHIPSATDELDAVVGATETATNAIMENCDQILNVTREQAPAVAPKVEESVVRIFEACTFQDITGQRIRKVTNSLKEIDARIKSILDVLDGSLADSGTVVAAAPADDKKDPLLNGPALPSQAVSQDDIDKLLAEFDKAGG